MNDQLDTAVRTALRDIIAAAPIAEARPTQVNVVDEISDHSRRGLYLAVAATLVVGVGVAGFLAIDTKRSGPDTSPSGSDSSQPGPDTSPFPPETSRTHSSGRDDGAITDPRAIDLAPWLTDAPAWPDLHQQDHLIFDIDALDGWTKVDETGWHQFDDGSSYVWAANVNDSDGRQFHLVVSDSVRYPQVVSGDSVDINGAAGIATEGELSWPLDATHIATVTEFGTADTARAIALARELTTTTVSTISIGGLGAAPEILADPAAPFAGVVDGFTWTASATPDSMTFIVDQTVRVTNTIDAEHRLSTLPNEIVQVGNNDLCVFIAGYVPSADTTVRLVLSDATAIALPTQGLEDGEHWFAACVPYALDATVVEIGSSSDQPVRHPLNWPLLRPTLGQRVTGGSSGLSQAYAMMSDVDMGRVCGKPDFNQVAMVASGLRADGNLLELWVAPTATGEGMTVLIAMQHNGEFISASSSCDRRIEPTFAETSFDYPGTDVPDSEPKVLIDISGRTDPAATRVRVTFASGEVVEADVQSDGYFVASLIGTILAYAEVKTIEPID